MSNRQPTPAEIKECDAIVLRWVDEVDAMRSALPVGSLWNTLGVVHHALAGVGQELNLLKRAAEDAAPRV